MSLWYPCKKASLTSSVWGFQLLVTVSESITRLLVGLIIGVSVSLNSIQDIWEEPWAINLALSRWIEQSDFNLNFIHPLIAYYVHIRGTRYQILCTMFWNACNSVLIASTNNGCCNAEIPRLIQRRMESSKSIFKLRFKNTFLRYSNHLSFNWIIRNMNKLSTLLDEDQRLDFSS